MTPDIREHARILGTEAGCTSARLRGLDDWDAEAERVARLVEREVLRNEEAAERIRARASNWGAW